MATSTMAQQGKRSPEISASMELGENVENKRRRLSPEEQALPASPLARPVEPIPDVPLLYQMAVTAHHSAQSHLQQAFIPLSTACPGKGFAKITLPDGQRFHHDPAASGKALGLLLLALQFLRIGLDTPECTFVERTALGAEFGAVGLKVLRILDLKGKSPQRLRDVLVADLQDIIGISLSIAQRNPHLKRLSQALEILNARLAYQENMVNLAKRLVRQTIRDTPWTDFSHRYSLFFLLLEFSHDDATDSLAISAELMTEANHRHHLQLVQLSLLARLRTLFFHRRWDSVETELQQLALSLGWDDDEAMKSRPDSPLRAHLEIHYLFYRCLWEGRIGNDNVVKAMLRKAYLLMDQAGDHELFTRLKADGGILEIPLGASDSISIQVTPPNVVYMMIFLVTVVSRKDYLGTKKACKTLVHAFAGREYAALARRDDMWDIGFHTAHSLADAGRLRQQICALRAEILLEELFALLYRMDVSPIESLTNDLIDLVRSHDLFSGFAPQITLLYATQAHLLGYSDLATRYYMACEKLLLPGSELALVVKIGQLSAQGLLCDVSQESARLINNMADQCRASSSATLLAVGHFLASLSDSNLVSAKKKLSQAYDVTQRANNNVLRTLIFAFTTSTHWTGSDERILKQMETGRDVAAMMGGLDREDRVGQLSLGLWFAVKLKKWYRMNEQQAELDQARRSAELHVARLRQLSQEGQSRFRQLSRLGVLEAPDP